ncbi:MAG: glycosyltransferase family 87 protein [Bryobacteraceae bacterium]
MQSAPTLRRWIGPLPGVREARAISWMALAAAAVLCALSLLYGFRGETFMGRPLGGDFVAFYVTGKILNEYEPARIYDLDLEVRLQHTAVAGVSQTEMLPFAHAPYIGQVFRPFALLPYKWAYVAWLVFSLTLYSAGLALLLGAAELPGGQRMTGFLLGLGSMAFLLETWIGGQLSVIGFFLVSLFVYCRSRHRQFLAGMVLALAMYKLTLVAIPIAMMLCGRRWRMLSGAAAGGVALLFASVATVGVSGCLAWFDTLRFFRDLATGPLAALHRNKYVDVGSFLHLLLGDASLAARVLAGLLSFAALGFLALAWWQSTGWSAASRDLIWAATFAGALVFNVYTPIYDTIVAGAAVAMVARVMRTRNGKDAEVFGVWLLLLYIVPWLTQSFAEFLRFQPITLVLAGFAYWSLSLAKREEAAISRL